MCAENTGEIITLVEFREFLSLSLSSIIGITLCLHSPLEVVSLVSSELSDWWLTSHLTDLLQQRDSLHTQPEWPLTHSSLSPPRALYFSLFLMYDAREESENILQQRHLEVQLLAFKRDSR